MSFSGKTSAFFKNAPMFCLKRPDVFLKRLGEFYFCLRVKIFGVGCVGAV